jgi:hypothetical protein
MPPQNLQSATSAIPRGHQSIGQDPRHQWSVLAVQLAKPLEEFDAGDRQRRWKTDDQVPCE